MHVLQLANFYGATTGGLRVAIDQLAQQYLAAGVQVTTVIAGSRNRRTVDAGGRTLVEVRAAQLPGRMGGYRMILNPGAVERMIEVLRPDVIELSDKTTLAAAATRSAIDTPVVLISHERLDRVVSQSFSRRAAVNWAVRRFNDRIGDRVDAVVCCSDFAADEFRADTSTPIERISLGVDLETFRPTATGPRNGRARLVSVVRLTVDKDPMVLVDTSRALLEHGVDHEWTIFGDGPLRSELEARSKDLPITWAGFVDDRSTLSTAIADADVGISPGPCETFGLAALELLACGTPVVVPDEGALQELVTPDVGRVCRRDGVSFAHGIAALLAGDIERQRRAARSHAEGFSWQASAERFLELYRRLDTTPGRRTPLRSAA